jgi:hypothetical protein
LGHNLSHESLLNRDPIDIVRNVDGVTSRPGKVDPDYVLPSDATDPNPPHAPIPLNEASHLFLRGSRRIKVGILSVRHSH